MADKQEQRPSGNTGEFRKVVEIGSASSWSIFELNAFKVNVKESESLPSLVLPYVQQVSSGSHDPDAMPPRVATKEWTQYRICQSGTSLC